MVKVNRTVIALGVAAATFAVVGAIGETRNPGRGAAPPPIAADHPARNLPANPASHGDPRFDQTRPQYLGFDPGPSSRGEQLSDVADDAEDCNIVLAARQDYPRLVLNTGGPVGTVRSLAFSPDSARLYSAGPDKAVQTWGFHVGARSIVRKGPDRAVLAQTLRWEITRGLRGAINVVAASPAGRRLAIGGYGARDSLGDVILYDTATAQVERALLGHRQPIVSLDFSPDGNHLLSVSRDGEVRLWSAAQGWNGRQIAGKVDKKLETGQQPARFLSDQAFVVSRPADDGKNWRLARYAVDGDAAGQPLDQLHGERIASVAVQRNGKRWASADWAGNVFVWDGAEANQPQLLRKGRAGLSMDFDSADRLFIATRLLQGIDDGKKFSQATLELWNVAAAEMLDQIETAETENNFACAVSPDGSRVVSYGGDNNELLVYALKDQDGKLAAKPLQRRPLRLRGGGRKVWRVAFADEDSYRLGFGTNVRPEVKLEPKFNDYGSIEEVFDLAAGTRSRSVDGDNAQIRWRGPNLQGWSVRVEQKGQRLALARDNEPWGTIDLDFNEHGPARSFCWIAGDDGQPYAAAVGTDVQQGVFVFGIGGKGEACPLLRYYRDHGGYVTSLSVSKDGKYLASASLDQTIKIWSLKGLRAQSAFGPVAGWGATFEMQNGQVVLTSAIEGGGATRKGLRERDVIVAAKFGRATAARLGKADETFDTTDPAEILQGLQETPLTQSLLLTVERLGTRLNQRILLVPAWEPLQTLFVDERGEWARWAPQGYYEASVNGDELFGWLINRGNSVTPNFYRADQFRNELERPGVMRRLLAVGNLKAALEQDPVPAVKLEAKTADDVLTQQIHKTPVVTIVEPIDAQPVKTDKVKVVARIDYPDAGMSEQSKGQAYVNGVPGNVVDDRRVGPQRTVEWLVPISDVYNKLRVVVEAADPRRRVGFSDVHFEKQQPPGVKHRKPHLNLFSLAVGDFKHVPTLQYPVADANAVTKSLKERSGKLYEPGLTVRLEDQQISKKSVAGAIDRLLRELSDARPDDLLVVFLAGHGLAIDNQYYFITFDAKEESVKEICIRWDELRRLSALPCRKLFLLDTCHSGNVLPINIDGDQHLKAMVRPLKQDEILVLSATDVGQLAVEFEALGHGIFTQCLLEALDGKAAAADRGQVNLRELVDYVEKEVPIRTAKVRRQTPRSSPTELFDVIDVPLVSLR